MRGFLWLLTVCFGPIFTTHYNASGVSVGHFPGVAPYFMNVRNVEFAGLLSVPPLGIFKLITDAEINPNMRG